MIHSLSIYPPGAPVAALRVALTLVLALAVAACAGASGTADNNPRPYDEKANARAAIAAALADNPGRKRILLTFGANWCSDSRSLRWASTR